MKEFLVSMDSNYSTTRLLSRREPEIVNGTGGWCNGVGEGFTPSRKIENGRWYACDFQGRRLFEVEPPEGFEIDLKEFKAKDGVVRILLLREKNK